MAVWHFAALRIVDGYGVTESYQDRYFEHWGRSSSLGLIYAGTREPSLKILIWARLLLGEHTMGYSSRRS